MRVGTASDGMTVSSTAGIRLCALAGNAGDATFCAGDGSQAFYWGIDATDSKWKLAADAPYASPFMEVEDTGDRSDMTVWQGQTNKFLVRSTSSATHERGISLRVDDGANFNANWALRANLGSNSWAYPDINKRAFAIHPLNASNNVYDTDGTLVFLGSHGGELNQEMDSAVALALANGEATNRNESTYAIINQAPGTAGGALEIHNSVAQEYDPNAWDPTDTTAILSFARNAGETYSGTADAGGAFATTDPNPPFIEFPAGTASSTDDYYKGWWVVITGGTGSGQARLIGSYNGTTNYAYPIRDWATAPDNTSTFSAYRGRWTVNANLLGSYPVELSDTLTVDNTITVGTPIGTPGTGEIAAENFDTSFTDLEFSGPWTSNPTIRVFWQRVGDMAILTINSTQSFDVGASASSTDTLTSVDKIVAGVRPPTSRAWDSSAVIAHAYDNANRYAADVTISTAGVLSFVNSNGNFTTTNGQNAGVYGPITIVYNVSA